MEEIERWERQVSPSVAVMELISRLPMHADNWFPEFVIALKDTNYVEALKALEPMLASASVYFFSAYKHACQSSVFVFSFILHDLSFQYHKPFTPINSYSMMTVVRAVFTVFFIFYALSYLTNPGKTKGEVASIPTFQFSDDTYQLLPYPLRPVFTYF